MYLSWLASRLGWNPISVERDFSDYDIYKIQFSDRQQQTIQTELAGLPMADAGDIVGDLVSIKLDSTKLDANCCTVLCSETSGCMRMESGGGAQSCRIQQVTSLEDQNTENLLGQQLQRWGRDLLYSESMAKMMEILAA
jgi:glucose-6-phosphate dehydrogenase assembly protein OpcA